MRSIRLTRRDMLRGMLGGAAITIGLPWLEAVYDGSRIARATTGGFPLRFGMFYWGNGMIPDRWIPQGEGANWTLSEQLQPLAAVKDKLCVITGMSVKVPNSIAHGAGAVGILAGARHVPGGSGFQHPTIDQLIAAEIGGQTRFRSLEFGALPGSGMSYAGPDIRNPPETSPIRLFERLFGEGFRLPGDNSEPDPTLALRRSVLDAVMDDSARLQARLGVADRQRLEQHLASIRDLELRIARLEEDPPQLDACAIPVAPPSDFPDIDGRPQVKARNRALCDIVALALACDQTRVFGNYLSDPVNNLLFDGATAGHHQLTHDEPGDQPQVHAIVLQIMEEFAYFIQALDGIREGDGTLLDNCALLGLSEISLGRTHSLDEMPLIIAGGLGGRIRKGWHYRSVGAENASKVHLTLMKALGMRATSFGHDEAQVSDTLGGIEA